MNKDKRSPQAFPYSGVGDDLNYSKGMSLRDYFAAKSMPLAMDRLRENYNKDIGDEWAWDEGDWESLAEVAYQLADEMMKASAA